MSWTSGEVINTQARLRRLSSAIPSSYTVFPIGGTYYAESNTAGGTDYEGANATTVIQQAVDALTAGRTWKEKIVIKGDIAMQSKVDVPSYTAFDLSQAKLTNGPGTAITFFQNSDQTLGNTQIDFYGGILDGYNAAHNQTILIALSATPSGQGLVTNSKIIDCTFLHAEYGFQLWLDCTDLIFQNNAVDGNSITAIDTPLFMGHRLKILHNNFYNAGRTNIYATDDVLVEGNIFSDNHQLVLGTDPAIDVITDIQIINNEFTDNTTFAAIWNGWTDAAHVHRRLDISHNIFRNVYSGIAPMYWVHQSKFNDNLFDTIEGHGLQIIDGKYNEIINNTFKNCSYGGVGARAIIVEEDGAKANEIDRFIIKNNIFQDCTLPLSYSGDNSIIKDLRMDNSGVPTFAGANNTYDEKIVSEAVQINGATTIPVMTFVQPAFITRAYLLYGTTVANDTNVEVGYGDVGAANRDKYVASVTSGTGAIWETEALTLVGTNDIGALDTVTFYQDGSGGVGEYIRLVIDVLFGV